MLDKCAVAIIDQVRKHSLKRVDALEAMQRQLQAKQRSLDIAKAACAASKQDLVRVRDNLVPSAQALHISFKVMSDAQGRLKVGHMWNLLYAAIHLHSTSLSP